MRLKRLTSLAFLYFAGASFDLHAQARPKTLQFSAEDDTVTPFEALPSVAIKTIANDHSYFRDEDPGKLTCTPHERNASPEPQLLCRRLSLGPGPGIDYLAIGAGPLHGAHIVPFWIVHVENGKARLMLSIVSDELIVGPNRYKGKLAIYGVWIMEAGAKIDAVEFHYHSGIYTKYKETEERPNDDAK